MDTRRGFLRGLGVAGAVSLGGCGALDTDPGPAEDLPESVGTDWQPRRDEWRLAAADHRNRREVGAFVTEQPAVRWRSSSDPPVRRVAAATRETVVVAAGGPDRFRPRLLRALSVTDGSERWSVAFDRPVRVGGLVHGTLFATVGGTEVVALAADDGSERWRVDHRARLSEAVPEEYLPAADFGLRVTPTPGELYALSGYGFHGLAADDGSERWRAHVPGDGFEPTGPAVGTNVVWGIDGRSVGPVVRLDGEGVHRSEQSAELRSAPVLPAGQRAAGRDGPALVAGHRPPAVRGYYSPGQTAWSFPGVGDDAAGPAALAVRDDRTFLTQTSRESGDGTAVLVALDVLDGTLDWLRRLPLTGDTGAPVATAPVVAGEIVLAGLPDTPESDGAGGLVGVDAQSGTERWRRGLEARPRRLAATAVTVHAVLDDGRLVTLTTDDTTA